MTEKDWLVSDQAHSMVEAIRDRLTERKALLFAVECVRRVRHMCRVQNLSALLDDTEQFAEGRITYDDWQDRVNPLGQDEEFDDGPAETTRTAPNAADCCVSCLCTLNPVRAAGGVSLQAAAAMQIAHGLAPPDWCYEPGCGPMPELHPEWAWQADLLRCIVGNPFRPVALDDAWSTSTVLALARGIYEDRAFDRMPILADALQDAGCENDDLLAHCRGDGPHARGCHVVDLILGKR